MNDIYGGGSSGGGLLGGGAASGGTDNPDPGEADKAPQGRRMSMMERFAKGVGFNLPGGGEGGGEDGAADGEDKEDLREAMVVRTMRLCRNKLIAARLEGEVSIARTVGSFTSQVKVTVGGGDKPTVEPIGELETKYTRIIQMMDGALENLNKRAKKWEDSVEIAPVTTLSRSYSIGLSDPIFGVVGLSMAVTIEVQLASLLTSLEAQAGLQSSNALHSMPFTGGGMDLKQAGSK